jgi:preprotein translocase subunit SecE
MTREAKELIIYVIVVLAFCALFSWLASHGW